jgi:glycerol-3-phosphate O-acyltransferase
VHHLLGDMISIADNQGVLLTYFRNNILHLFIVPSLVASLIKHNGRINRDEIGRIITTLYPFLKAELFLKWRVEVLSEVVEREVQALIDAGLVVEDGADMLYSPSPNTEQHNQLSVLAAPVQQSLERYFMTLTLITRQGSGRVSAKQIEDLSHLLGQRLSVLYEFNSPEFFDKALFRSFIAALAEQQYLTIDADGIMHFDHQLETIAGDAHLVLNEDTLNTLQHVTCVTDDEVQAAMNALERKKERKRRS